MSLFYDVFSLRVHFEFFAIFCYCLHFCQISLLVKETAEIETGLAEKSSWDQANIWQKLGLVWRNGKKISQIIKDNFYLPFFLLIILWRKLSIEFPSSTPGGKMQNFPRFLPQYFLLRDSFLFSVEENVGGKYACRVIFAVSNTRFWTIFVM
jgi:hypothetical protein